MTSLLGSPHGKPRTGRQFDTPQSPNHELTDLFYAVASILASDNQSAPPTNPNSFESLAPAERLSSFFGVFRMGLCTLDTGFRYLAINQSMAEMNGVPVAEHLGRTVREVLGDFAEEVEPQFNRVLATAQPLLNVQISFVLDTRREPGHWIEHYIPIKDSTGKVIQIGVIALEVTEQKRLQESLQSVSQKLKEESLRFHAITEISRVLTTRLGVQQTFPKVSAHLRRVLRQEYAALALRNERTGQLSVQALDFPLGKSASVDRGISAKKDPRNKVLMAGISAIFDAGAMNTFPPGTSNYFLAEGLKSLCCVPLLHHKKPVGVLVLGSTRPDAFHNDDLVLLNQVAAQLALALENAEIAKEVKLLKTQLGQEKATLSGEAPTERLFEEIIGQSAALKEVLDRVEVVAATGATVLVLGETGTGKGLIARALHRISARNGRPFITLNCAAIPTGLLESELFGHEKGAFTGAVSQKIGRLELADKGTLFLDEIGEIPLELQPKLLRVLQDYEFERLGGTRTIKVDLRLIAATNRDLTRSIAEKEFRSDLFYRLNVFPIRMPSLRERTEDIPLLVGYFVRKFAAAMGRVIDSIPRDTMDALVNWQWPGNVRELENFIERSVIMTEGTTLRAPLAEFLAETSHSPEHSLGGMERDYIVRVLRETGGILSGPSGAARRLGLKRTTLQSKIQRLGIERSEYFGEDSGQTS